VIFFLRRQFIKENIIAGNAVGNFFKMLEFCQEAVAVLMQTNP
jgi:hypothetical protein